MDTFLIVTTGREVVAGTQWIKDRDAIKHPTRHRTSPRNRELSGLNVNSAETEKLFYKLSQFRITDLFFVITRLMYFLPPNRKFQKSRD